MLAEVLPARLDGMPLPRWQWGPKTRVGNLIVFEAPCPEDRRIVRTARLLCESDVDLLLPLRDASLLAICSEYLTFTGYEVHDFVGSGRLRMYRQSWIARVLERAEFDKRTKT